ncbi:MAG: bifunctional UDP-N-acetylmuramoyl-tripeptide:D-alanyl-D-alanine ligase/alanine racemase [Saprospiraceae bacterium]
MYPVYFLQQITKAQWLQRTNSEAQVAHLSLDSRQVIFAKSALFFAIPGAHHDGHNYITQAYQQGVRNFIVSKKIQLDLPSANVLLVEDSLLALQQIATFHRQQFALKSIGITGSNGKTIVKELLFQFLRNRFKIVRSPKSYNSQIGVPLSVWQIEEEHELGIFEAGISQPEEMEKLAPIIDCQIGLFTNIGPAHAEGFESEEQKIEEKLKLFKQSECIIYCKDFSKIDKAISKLDNKKIFTWSKEKDADFQILNVLPEKTRTHIKAIFQKKEINITIPFSDEAYIENVIHCWATLLYLGIENNYIQEQAVHLEPVAMRLELKNGINGCTIINDSYNADLGSLQIALQFLKQQRQQKRTLILSDILQSGRSEDTLYKEVAQLIKEQQLSRFIGIGKNSALIKPFLPKGLNSSFHNNISTFLEKLNVDDFQQEAILLKGARKFEFERIANRLSQKVHRTTLEINLNALSHNLQVYSRRLEAGTKLMVMVKASAYGSGSAEVARLLSFNQVDYLAVAYTDEGIDLRKAGIQLPIMVLNPEKGSIEEMLNYDLEPEIYSFDLLNSLLPFTENTVVEIHLKLNTGMNRLGFSESDIQNLTIVLQQYSNLTIKSIFSHLAASEDSDHDSFTQSQIQRFNNMYTQLSKSLDYNPMRHLLNSGGIVRFPEQHMEMVRLGLGLYGVDSSSEIQQELETALTLKASISQINEVAAGETIGYSRKGVVAKNMRSATISIGYADGLLRSAGNGKHSVSIHGKLAPIIGNICMDMCMVDVSNIPEAKEGDEVIVFGVSPTVTDLAQSMGTIAYEVFTGISERVKRVYIQE